MLRAYILVEAMGVLRNIERRRIRRRGVSLDLVESRQRIRGAHHEGVLGGRGEGHAGHGVVLEHEAVLTPGLV